MVLSQTYGDRDMRRAIFLSLLTVSISINADTRDLNSKEIAAIETAVKENLKDPDSAKFNFGQYLDNKSQVYCGYVNAKNSYGGYTGNQLFSVMISKVNEDKYAAFPLGVDYSTGEPATQEVISATCAGAGYSVSVKKFLAKNVNKVRKENGLPPLPIGQISE